MTYREINDCLLSYPKRALAIASLFPAILVTGSFLVLILFHGASSGRLLIGELLSAFASVFFFSALICCPVAVPRILVRSHWHFKSISIFEFCQLAASLLFVSLMGYIVLRGENLQTLMLVPVLPGFIMGPSLLIIGAIKWYFERRTGITKCFAAGIVWTCLSYGYLIRIGF